MSIKWIYGRQDWKTFVRGQENCYLMTNGLGGYSSLTMTGSAARGDHAFLMACLKAPNNRWNMIHRLAETLEYPGSRVILSSQDFRHDSTNWNGCDDISRTLKLRNLRLTGREIILPRPIVFRGVDPDMGHHYNWTYPVSIIAETEMNE